MMNKIYSLISFILLISMGSYAQYDSIAFGGQNRTYLLDLPIGYNGVNATPLIIAMHGGFGSAINIRNQSQLSAKGDSENFIVVYPEGVKGGVLNIRTWNAGWCCGFASRTDVDDVGFIDALLDKLISQYAIDTNRIYATGMSNGGFMSYRLACELSERIAAIAPVAATMSMISCNPNRPVPVIAFHSYLDTNVPYLGGPGSGTSNHYNSPQDSVLHVWGNKNNCTHLKDTIVDNDEYTFVKWSSCDCASEVDYYITHDGGHSWPGGMKTIIGDPVSIYINANDLMWSFFQKHTVECGTTSIQDALGKGFKAYPNPTSGELNIEIDQEIIQLVVYNQFGDVVLKSRDEQSINLNGQPRGVYLIEIHTKADILKGRMVKN